MIILIFSIFLFLSATFGYGRLFLRINRLDDLNLSFGETFQSRLPDAYERLLIDTARGNQTLFMRFDEVLAAWNYIDKLVSFLSKEKLKKYDQGSMGPADTILEKSGHEWFEIY